MDTSPVVFQNHPENTKKDQARFEKMRIVGRPYGAQKVFFRDLLENGMACEKCVFDSGKHSCGK